MAEAVTKTKRNTESILSVIEREAQKVQAKDKPLSLSEIADGASKVIRSLRDEKHMTIDDIVEFLRTKAGVAGSKERVRKEVSRVLGANGSAS